MAKKVIVTGCAGYIGSAVVLHLLSKGYKVIGVDNLSFGGEAMLPFFDHPEFTFYKTDVVNKKEIDQVFENEKPSGVIHLAAIVGDPACKAQPDLARAVNINGSLNLFEAANKSGSVEKFVFTSTCSNYGKMAEGGFVNEESKLNPVSLYAETKVEVEKAVLSLPKRDSLAPVVLRFSTAYGTSGRPRFDLTVNEFVRDTVAKKELVIFGELFWRPYCHVLDLARACVVALEAPANLVSGQVFGVGATEENYQKKTLSDLLMKVEPELKIKFVPQADDPRDYRVNFDKIRSKLGFTLEHNVPGEISKMFKMLKMGVISELNNKSYNNLSK